MKNFPAWIPNFNAWMSAILLLLLVRGIKFVIRAISEHTNYRIFSMLWLNNHIALELLIALSPIIVIAIAHNLLHIFLDLFAPDIQSPEMSVRKYWFPGLMSWWEGLYGWLAIALTIILSSLVGIIFFSRLYYLSAIDEWWFGTSNFINPPSLIRLICVAYLYQFEHLVRQHLIVTSAKR